jgi:hypothetical protein
MGTTKVRIAMDRKRMGEKGNLPTVIDGVLHI